jgi:TRAP-type mannitol/chloroaromatic compound transport system permease large subunit
VFTPILTKLDFADHLGQASFFMAWFGTLVAVNLQTSFMTPPFGATLFYLKGTVPPGISMSDVYRGMWPFVAIQIIGLILCIAFPELVLWLPRKAGMLD